MKRLWGLLWVTLLGLPLITPLMSATAVSCTHDGHLHYHRIATMRHAWENGLFFSRWLPDLAFGYGYPFFVYREPVPLYAGLFPHLLGMSLPAASNLFYGICILSGGWFAFLWMRDLFGERAGVITAVSYMTAPYILIDALIRGNSPESAALALFPLLLWAGRRWMLGRMALKSSQEQAVSFLIGTFGLALLSLSHNISTLLFSPVLLVYLLIVAWVRRVEWKISLLRVGLLFGLGLGMTFFYSGGALLELDQVTLEQSTVTRNNDFHFNFTSLDEIFAPVAPEDPMLVNPPMLLRLGWVPVGLAVLGILVVILQGRGGAGRQGRKNLPRSRSSHDHRSSLPRTEKIAHVWMMVAGTAVFLFMSLSISQPIWENVPLIDFVQFPWRFVGRAALPVAFLAGIPFASKPQRTNDKEQMTKNSGQLVPILFFIAITLLIIEAVPNLYPNQCSEDVFPTINTVYTYEHQTGLVGVDPEGSYFPRTVQKRPSSSSLEPAYQTGTTPQRFELPTDVSFDIVEQQPLGTTIQLNAPAPFTARYLSFDFPGWVAFVDGNRVPITPNQPDGLITFPIPAGAHTVQVRWQSTPTRTLLLGLSLMALAGTLVTAVISSQWTMDSRQWSTTNYPLSTIHYPLIIAVVLLVGKMAVFDRMNTPLRHLAAPPVSNSVGLQGGELRLDGFNLSAETAVSGGTFDIDLAWTAVSPPVTDYQSNVWLVDENGLIWSDKETFRPRIYEDMPRTLFWLPGQWGWDSREVAVFSGTPPGKYDIVLTLFELETLAPLTLTDVNGTVIGPTAVIGQINVTAPEKQPPLTPQIELTAVLPNRGLSLLGYHQDRDAAIPGEIFLLTLYWLREGEQSVDSFNLALLNEAGEQIKTWQLATTRPDFEAWQIGQQIRGQYLFRLPAGLDNGRYQFILQNEIMLGTVNVTAPDRMFDAPEMETAVDIPFSQENNHLITLTGYTQSTINHQLSTIN